jgi:hypothetical protein
MHIHEVGGKPKAFVRPRGRSATHPTAELAALGRTWRTARPRWQRGGSAW